MAQYITTYSGVHFYPLAPETDGIKIEDIAHSLSLLCRANGHYKDFYSVADHCVDCAEEARARGYSDEFILICLLHDASEAYISDIPRPVKGDLKGIDEIEKRLSDVIYKALIGRVPDDEEIRLLKDIDDAMLYHEFKANMGEELKYGEIKAVRSFKNISPKAAEDEFLSIYYQLAT